MIINRQLGKSQEMVVRMVFTNRLAAGGGGEAGPGGSSRAPFHFANLGSHVGDDPAVVVANRERLAEALGINPGFMSFMHPDHGRGTAWVGLPGVGLPRDEDWQPGTRRVRPASGTAAGGELRNIDAMLTAQPGVGLVALSADCATVVLVSQVPAMVAVVHTGWRGVLLNVVGAAVLQLMEAGAQPEMISAWMGPTICAGCYPVAKERAAEVGAVVPQALGTARDGQPAIDVRRGATAQLLEFGVAVHQVGGCTFESDEFYSHRREGLTGRQGAAVVMLAKPLEIP